MQVTLLTNGYETVARIEVPFFETPPGAIMWESRCFVFTGQEVEPFYYRETFLWWHVEVEEQKQKRLHLLRKSDADWLDRLRIAGLPQETAVAVDTEKDGDSH